MRILAYMSSAYPFVVGGAQVTFESLVASLRRRGVVTDELYRAPLLRASGPMGDKWQMPIRRDLPKNGLPSFRSLIRSAKSIAAILSLLAVRRPDVVYVHFIKKETAYFILFRSLFRYRLILGARGSDVLVSNGILHDREIRRILDRADAVIANSDAVKDQVKAMASHNIDVTAIHNGIDVKYWARPTNNAKGDNAIIISVGRLEHVKGHDILIRAFSQVLDGIPAARLEIVGDGSERRALEELADELGLTDQVVFFGTLDRTEIRDRFHAASIFAMPSRTEGFGIAALEALASGLPVVGSDVGGLPELVGPESGILVQPEDPDALARATLHVLQTAGLADSMSQAASLRASEFAWEKAVDRYLSVFVGDI